MGKFMDVSRALAMVNMSQGNAPFLGSWNNRNRMNTPGTLYCAIGDNCGSGPLIAPNNIATDEDGYDIVFRQPVNNYELGQVLEAADTEPFQSYGMDGDVHWSYTSIREWWRSREEIEAVVQKLYMKQVNLKEGKNYHEFSMLSRWLSYYKEGLHEYLQVYSFYVEEGRIPTNGDQLPVL